MHAASERQYTTAVREIQVLKGGSLFTSDGRWSEDKGVARGGERGHGPPNF